MKRAGAALLVLVLAGCNAVPKREPVPKPAPAPPKVAVPPIAKPAPEPEPVPEPEREPPREVIREVKPPPRTDPWLKPGPPRFVSDSESLLLYFSHLRKLSGAELAREHEAVRQLYAKGRTDFNRVRYAMLLSIAGAPFADESRAQEALEPLLKNQESPLYPIAFLVNASILEQRRAADYLQKLEALKSLEKSLLERDSGRPR